MTRDETSPFALGEPCAQSKDGELLWSFDAIAQAVEEARAAERARCADIARRTVCDVHTPTGVKIYGTRAAKAIMEDGA